ncbi:bifunctional 2-polyprenyl-6-hydroxyphenol methylase/3-demethylubiquinol 3-O-methyltransferase UbiG [uncultured Nevskia sp.]|uniref:bifunctional 2-polyprenyl-6-hydroxyphenol methylase/3-demethylubiquinol 3-O-methyltransferase UbiG n=1 Tax=uncultured Nevskia sp. TaxID=228950 RepID=UPI0025D66B05|nr:bifunctional 2-polyprenyl-6-hydroxyphenol methylase/3-demethylubiquinol 3-O-methyltransferase UbiG [uncultured Nevskia sp.]
MSRTDSGNVDHDEISRFEALAARWWDRAGEMGALHVINPPRMRYIQQRTGGASASIKGKRTLDVGCGGGILTEALAIAGADALGIDLATASIEVAKQHAEEAGLKVDYRVVSAEVLAEQQAESFDLVCCLEMLEHVPDPAETIEAIARLVKPGGDVVFSTINRNPKSYALMIVGAEYVARIVPRGTHDYAKFIRPSELDRWARNAGLVPQDVMGLRYNPLLKSASLNASDIDVNYLMHCRKPAED